MKSLFNVKDITWFIEIVRLDIDIYIYVFVYIWVVCMYVYICVCNECIYTLQDKHID